MQPVSHQRLARAAGAFRQAWDVAPQAVCDAPGRVNLIGEHIDYAGGSVLPFAIQYGTAIAASWSTDGPSALGKQARKPSVELQVAPGSPVQPTREQLATATRLATGILERLNFSEDGQVDQPSAHQEATTFAEGGPRTCSLGEWRCAIWSDLPIGAGLSSSAALGIALAGVAIGTKQRSVRQLNNKEERRSIALPRLGPVACCQLVRDAEEGVTGVQCGLMDQYASMFGQSGSAVHFGTVSLTHQYAPLALPDAVLAVIDSGQARTLGSSAYNERRAELQRGVRDRVRHVQGEKKRVVAAVRALAEGNAQQLGELLIASHASLRQDYEVSTPQLDLLCQLLLEADLAWGARLTGAGFGGNVLALLKRAAVEPGCIGECPLDLVLTRYAQQTGLTPTLRLVTPSAGAQLQIGTGDVTLLHDWLAESASAPSAGPVPSEDGTSTISVGAGV